MWDFHGKVWDFHAGTTHGPLSRSQAQKLRKERETISPTHVHTRLWESICYMKGRGKNFLSNSHRWKRHAMLWSTTSRWMGISSLFVLHCFALMSVEPHFNLHLRRLPWCCLTSSDSNEKCASHWAFAVLGLSFVRRAKEMCAMCKQGQHGHMILQGKTKSKCLMNQPRTLTDTKTHPVTQKGRKFSVARHESIKTQKRLNHIFPAESLLSLRWQWQLLGGHRSKFKASALAAYL